MKVEARLPWILLLLMAIWKLYDFFTCIVTNVVAHTPWMVPLEMVTSILCVIVLKIGEKDFQRR
jgi:hypothetical protein